MIVKSAKYIRKGFKKLLDRRSRRGRLQDHQSQEENQEDEEEEQKGDEKGEQKGEESEEEEQKGEEDDDNNNNINILYYNRVMNYDEPNSRIGYWKRHFDDERRNKVPCQRPEPLPRRSETIEQQVISSLKSEINTYKQMLYEESSRQEDLFRSLCIEREKTRKYKFQLQEIKKCLEK